MNSMDNSNMAVKICVELKSLGTYVTGELLAHLVMGLHMVAEIVWSFEHLDAHRTRDPLVWHGMQELVVLTQVIYPGESLAAL